MNEENDRVEFVEPQQLRQRLSNGERLAIVDVRSVKEFADGHVEGAINIPEDQLNDHVDELAGYTAVVTVCTFGGARSCGAAEKLRDLGIKSVAPLRGGLHGWQGDQEN